LDTGEEFSNFKPTTPRTLSFMRKQQVDKN